MGHYSLDIQYFKRIGISRCIYINHRNFYAPNRCPQNEKGMHYSSASNIETQIQIKYIICRTKRKANTVIIC